MYLAKWNASAFPPPSDKYGSVGDMCNQRIVALSLSAGYIVCNFSVLQ